MKKRKEWRDFTGVRRFTPSEFPEDPEKYSDPVLIHSLDDFAVVLGKAVHPSPAPGALARLDGSKTSRHYAVKRLSDGVDVFCRCSIFRAWATAMMRFGGVGVYFDTMYQGRPWPMLHLDKRQKKTIWFRDEQGQYHYPGTDLNFYQGLVERLAIPAMIGG